MTHDGSAELAALLAAGGITALLQPVVDLATSSPVGYEALARGPQGHPLHEADALFAAGYEHGLLDELDAACVAAALTAARQAGLRAPRTLFVNLEVESAPRRVLPLRPPPGVQVVVELTERALLADPAAVLATVDHVRALGWGVALDDVGVDPASLALLPLLRPDVVKLDASLVARPPDAATAALFSAVAAESERTGALVLAEGIETAAHLGAARALGARLGQGWLFGRPVPAGTRAATEPDPVAGQGIRLDLAPTARPAGTPFALASAALDPLPTDGDLIAAMSRHLERQAAAAGGSTVVLATFRREPGFAPAARRYATLAERAVFVAVLGEGVPPEPAPGVRGVALDPADPLAAEWDLVVLGPHVAALLTARPAADEEPRAGAGPTRYDYVLTHDRQLVVAAARALASSVTRDPGARPPRTEPTAAPASTPTTARTTTEPATGTTAGPPAPRDPVTPGLAGRLSTLARDLGGRSGSTDVLERVVSAALALVPGAEEASISVAVGRARVESRVPSGRLPRLVDAAQTDTGQGPCLDALHVHRVVRVPDMAAETRWPEFTRRAVALGAGSMLSFQLWADDARLGALNLFSRSAGAFTDESEHVGEIVAAHAAVAFAAVRGSEALQAGLAGRDLVGQAKGMVMERFAVTADHAFDLLVQLSRDSGTPLREVAGRLVHAEDRPVAALDGQRLGGSGVRDFRSAFDHAPIGVAITDPHGTLLTVNPALARLLGGTPSDLVGTTLFERTHPEDLDDAVAACAALRDGPLQSNVLSVRLRDPGGRWVPATVSTAKVVHHDGTPAHLVMHVEDATPHQALTEQLTHAALHDPLTGLPNRTLFLDRLQQGAGRHRRSGAPLSVLFCDVDAFKTVNDQHGHAAGDEVLRAIADRLRASVRPGDTAARLGGDEFAVLCEGADAGAARTVARRVAEAFRTPVVLGRTTIAVTVSVGAATSGVPELDPTELLDRADAAMYRVKRAAGR